MRLTTPLNALVLGGLLSAGLSSCSESSPPDGGSTASGSLGPVAEVKTAASRRGSISENITVYGSIVPAPGAVQTVSVAYESRVLHVMVSDGQRVSGGDLLLEIEPSPDTQLKLVEAKNAREIAHQSLDHMTQKFDMKLATNDQLLKAQEAFRSAELRLKSLDERGVDGKRELHADRTGLSSKVYVRPGAIVPAGQPLVDLISEHGLEARMEVEAEDVPRVRSSQSISLSYVNVPGTEAVDGVVRKISRAVNPETRSVDVFVSLPDSASFLLGEYVVGRITVASSEGLVVPRLAVLPVDGRHVLFTVDNGRAVRHFVEVGLENDREVEILASDIPPNAMVVVLGNHELSDGMSVKLLGSK